MKKFLFTIVASGTLLASATGVFAGMTASDERSGSEVVTEDSGLVTSFIPTGKQSRLDDGAMDGGWWTRGKRGDQLVSEYKHYTKKGHASCLNGNGTRSDPPFADPNVWCKSHVGYTLLGDNHVYYNHK